MCWLVDGVLLISPADMLNLDCSRSLWSIAVFIVTIYAELITELLEDWME